ncbi:MAG: acyl-ACP--UDP-N-acetylglucosamine O-acyltransferase [Planctomycetota bacterium]|jgi:UDP-N-acetylglucosamine acyltransferase
MPTVHATAILEGEVDLADDVVVGPHCVITGPVKIGPGSRLIGNAYLHGPIEMGSGNVVYPFTCLGFAPQHVAFDPARAGPGLRIGDGNTFREHVTVHRAFEDGGPTTVGDRNYFMGTSHLGHDCRLGSDCVLVQAAKIGGHVEIGDKVIFGGASVVHQHCRIGRGAMFSGQMGTGRDVPPFFLVTGIDTTGTINLIGLRRSGMPRDAIDDVRWVFRVLVREGHPLPAAIEKLRERADRPMVREYIEFLEGSTRGICLGAPKAERPFVASPGG